MDQAIRRELGSPVGFIGGHEKERAASICKLAQGGIPVRVWERGHWLKHAAKSRNLKCEY